MIDKVAAAYRRPFLAADEVSRIGDDRIVLRREDREVELEVTGEAVAAEAWLESLRDPDSPSWAELDPDAGEAIRSLDHNGWLLDAGALPDGDDGDLAGRAAAWLGRLVARHGVDPASRRRIDWARVEARALVVQLDTGTLAADWPAVPGLALRTLLVQLRVWQRTAPEALRAIADAFDSAAGSAVAASAAAAPWLQPQTQAPILWQACALLAAALAEDEEDCPPAGEAPPDGPAINVLVEAENRVRRLLERIGDAPVAAILADPAAARSFARSVFLHQHRLTERFVECILPLMRRRLDPPLRALVYRYFDEETGHEAHERAICLRLGLGDDEVDAFLPLPFFGAYVDMLGYAAETDPLAFMLSLCAAEGLPGTRKPLPGMFAAAGIGEIGLSDHTDIDEALNHSVFSRRLFAQVGRVASARAAPALARFLDIVELSQRAWHQAARAVESGLPTGAGAFEIEPAALHEVLRTPVR